MVYVTLLIGFALLIAGGEGFVRGAVSIARKFGMSPLLIGLTLMSIGTSLPELVTSVQAALDGAPGIAVGNVVGSNIANILLILGITALIFPVTVDKGVLYRDGGVLVLASLACLGVIAIGTLSRTAGFVFIVLLVAYISRTYAIEKRNTAALRAGESARAKAREENLWLALLLTLGGMALIIAGARLLVSSAVELATAFGVSETIIGLTVIAIGTSLPELVTSGLAAIKRHTDMALGNIIGSNIFNIFAIMGATALVQPIPVPDEIIRFDIWIMLAATGLLLVFAYTGRTIVRWEGGVFLAGYIAYLAWLVLTL